MALATQCPHCHTRFRVAADQLKLRGGIVRCGNCQSIFDGNAHLIDLDAPAPAEGPPAAPAASPAPAPAPVPAPAPEPAEEPAPPIEDDIPVQTLAAADRVEPVFDAPEAAPPAGIREPDTLPETPAAIDAAAADQAHDVAPAAPQPRDFAPRQPDAPAPSTYSPPGRIEPSFGPPVEPAPEPEPEPAPEPTPEPTPEPVPEPEPEPKDAPPAPSAHGLPSEFFAYVEQEIAPAVTPPEITRRPPRAPWPPLDFGPEPAPARAPEPEPAPTPAPAPAPVPAVPQPEPEPAPEPEPEPEPAAPPVADVAPVADAPDIPPADDEPAPPAALPLRAAANSDGPVTEMPLPDAPVPPRSARAKSLEARARRSKLTPTPIDETPRLRVPETDEPEFVKRSRRLERSGRLRRIGMGAGSALLLLLLAAQGVMEYRNVLAARYPALQPALVAVCAPFGCRVGLPAQVDSLVIETGELSPLGADTYSLNTLLRNQGSLVQAWPSIELELVDDNNKALLRRVFAPADYLPAASVAAGFAPRSEQPVRLDFALTNLKPAGYHLFVFYP